MTRRASILLWVKWTLASFTGASVAFLVVLPLTFFLVQLLISRFEPADSPVEYLYVFLATIIPPAVFAGMCLGAFQFLVLRKWFKRPVLWIPATGIGCALTAVSFFTLMLWLAEVSPVAAVVSYFFCGALVGLPQWLVLRKSVQRSIWWIPATSAAIFSGIFLSSGIASLLTYQANMPRGIDESTEVFSLALLMFSMLTGPLVYSMISAGALVVLLRPDSK